MNIRSALVAGIAAVVLLVAGAAALNRWYATRFIQVDIAQSQVSLASRDVAGLMAMGQDAALHYSPRVGRQWRAIHATLVQSLQNLSQQLAPQHRSQSRVAELLAVVSALPAQFNAVAEADISATGDLANARRDTLMTHMSIETRRVSDGVFELAEVLLRERADLRTEQLNWLRWMLLAYLTVTFAGALYIYRRILRPLGTLKATALQIQRGDMSARNAMQRRDELGMLARTFDAMTHTVQERQLALQSAQRESARLYDTLLQHSIVSTADRSGTITDVNESFCQISGFSREELIGQNHRIVNSGHQSNAFWMQFWITITSGLTWRGEICNRTKDGALYWVDSMVVPMRDENGVVERYISIRNDITGRKASEAALLSSERMFSSSFQNAASGMATLSIRGQWLEINPALCHFLGYTAEDLKMLTFADVTHPDELAFDHIQLPRLIAGEIDVYERTKRFVHQEGHTVWGLVSVSVVRDVDTAALFTIAQIVDVTARKRAEEALQVSTVLLEESQEIAKVGGWELNLETGALYWTAETYRIHETTPDEFDPTVDAGVDYFLPESRARIQLALQSAIEQREPYDLELETLTTKGTRIDVRTTGKPWIVDDKVVRLSGIFQDITERKRYENALKEARSNAEQAAQSKGQFLANMSHEIRTPMNAILGLLNLLQTTDLTARQRDYASKTEGAAQSLLGLLNDILDFSKVDAGKMTLESEPFRIDRLLRNLSVVLSANVGAKDIEVLFDVDPALPEVVQGDAMRLQQVLINLGGNAIKFTSTGQVVLALRKQRETPHTVTIEFSVQDSGIGIAPEHQSHIFSGFSQAEGSTTRRFGGTGLGLAISKRFVELMGGDIAVSSAIGTGSTFAFALELPTVQRVPDALAASARPTIAPQRVLVVDDNPIAGALTLRMVQSWGWTAELADTGDKALEWVTEHLARAPDVFPYPLIYMDWQMPRMDGWETTRRIRQLAQQHQLVQPTVIMVTAHGRETLAQRSEAEQDMLNGFLVKPVTASMLFDALVDASAGSSGLRQLTKGRSSKRQLAGMRILVVEDNLINQQVAEELLGGEGALVSLAANGRIGADAVAAAAPQFDVVLMDIQMPVLDGYGATKVIREELGLKQLPIIAMTANAMASDRAACLAADMSEHIGKPFDMAKLVVLLLRITGFQASGDALAYEAQNLTDAPSQPEVPGLDLGTALARMAGMRSLYVRTARDFCRILDTIVAELQQCIACGDRKQALMRLHTLKGNAGTLGASALAELAGTLERLCKTDAGMAQCAADLSGLTDVIAGTQAQLEQAMLLLAPAALPAQDGAPVEVNMALAASTLHQLKALTYAADLDALQCFAQLRTTIAGLPDGFCDRLDEAMQNLDLDSAHALCNEMLVKLAA